MAVSETGCTSPAVSALMSRACWLVLAGVGAPGRDDAAARSDRRDEAGSVRRAAERPGRQPSGAGTGAGVGHVLARRVAGDHEAVVAALDRVRAPAARRVDRARVLPGPPVRGKVGDPVGGAARGLAGPDRDEPGAVERHAADGGLGAVIDGDRHRRPLRSAVGAQPYAGSAVGDHRGGPVRGGEVNALRGHAGLLQPQLRGRHPLPGHAVMRGPDHRLIPGAGRLVAGGQEPAGCVGDHVDRVTVLPRGDPVRARQRPGQPVRAGPDGVVAFGHPSVRAAGDPDGLDTPAEADRRRAAGPGPAARCARHRTMRRTAGGRRRRLSCEPVVTIVFPEATMRWIVWKTPRARCPG